MLRAVEHLKPSRLRARLRRSPANGPADVQNPPRLVLRFAVSTAVLLSLGAFVILIFVRQHAITRGQRTRFQVVGSDSYSLQWDSAGTWVTIRGPMRLEKEVVLTSTGGNLIFQPRGIVSPASTLTISDPVNPEHRLVITVPITGLVRIRAGGG